MLSCMRIIALVACLFACVHRVDMTRVTLRDSSELAIEGSGSVPQVEGAVTTGLSDHDMVLVGRPSDVHAFDDDKLRMHLTQNEVRYCRGQRCDRRVLDLRVDTPLANVRSISAVGVVVDRRVIPLGIVVGSVLTGWGGGMLAYEVAEREHLGSGPAPFMFAIGLALLAVEIHARIASDTVTVVR